MNKLSDLPNIGGEIERQLNDAGIYTLHDLKRTGAKEAWLKILSRDSSACINRLYSLQGAICGISKKMLDEDVKKELKDFYNNVKGKNKA